jgi:recombinase
MTWCEANGVDFLFGLQQNERLNAEITCDLHRAEAKSRRTGKPETEIVEMAVPPIVDKDEFEVVQMLLKSRSPAMVAPRVVSGRDAVARQCQAL